MPPAIYSRLFVDRALADAADVEFRPLVAGEPPHSPQQSPRINPRTDHDRSLGKSDTRTGYGPNDASGCETTQLAQTRHELRFNTPLCQGRRGGPQAQQGRTTLQYQIRNEMERFRREDPQDVVGGDSLGIAQGKPGCWRLDVAKGSPQWLEVKGCRRRLFAIEGKLCEPCLGLVGRRHWPPSVADEPRFVRAGRAAGQLGSARLSPAGKYSASLTRAH
jgi:hypothetical protein